MATDDLTAARLRELLHYDSTTGVFRRLVSLVYQPKYGVGTAAGGVQVDGCIAISVDGKLHKAHRLAWLYVTGNWPVGVIDHISGNRQDNSFANLRDVTSQINTQNQRAPQTKGTSGFLGVTWSKRRQKWMAQIGVNGKNINLGGFESAQDASLAYLAAKQKLHPLAKVSENAAAPPQRHLRGAPKSGHIGAYKQGHKWFASILVNGKSKYLGRFPTPELASAAYLAAKAEIAD